MLFILCGKNKRQINPELSQVLQFNNLLFSTQISDYSRNHSNSLFLQHERKKLRTH